MRRIPPEMHGRAFAALRTLMQGTAPLGSAVAAPLLLHGGVGWTTAVMVALAGLPGLGLLRYPDKEKSRPGAGGITSQDQQRNTR
ncbi:hypothetical protein [Streptomyces sp. SGAir0957]